MTKERSGRFWIVLHHPGRVKKWFVHQGVFNHNDQSRPGYTLPTSMKTLYLSSRRINRKFPTKDIAKSLKIAILAAFCHLKELGFKKKSAILKNRKTVIFQLENGRMHVEKNTLQNLNE